MGKKTLLTQIESHLKQLNLHFEKEEGNNSFSLSFDMENTQIDVRITCDTEVDRTFLSGFSTIKVPKEKRPSILEKINQIHWEDYWNAHLLINDETKSIMSYAVLYAFEGLDYEVFKETLGDITNIIDAHFKELMQIIVNPDLCEMAMKMQGNDNLAN